MKTFYINTGNRSLICSLNHTQRSLPIKYSIMLWLIFLLPVILAARTSRTSSTRSSTSVSASTSAATSASASSTGTFIEIPQYIIDKAASDQAYYDSFTDVSFTNLELYQHALLFAETFLSPNNSVQAAAINSTFFTEDCIGRIDITRVYTGQELNTEYLFGLFVSIADSDLVNIFGYATSYELYEFNGYGDQYSFSIILNAIFPLFNNETIPFEANIYIKLNEEKQIRQYDLQFKRWDRFYEIILQKGVEAITGTAVDEITDSNLEYLQTAVSQSICAVHETYCAGTEYQQYNSTDACLDYLINDIPFGEAWEGGRDTVFCRSLHQNMVSYRPSVHCDHIGPGGGDMCINSDTGYEEVVFGFHNYFDSRPFINI